MVVIRRGQMKALQRPAISDLARRLAVDLREKLGQLLVLFPNRSTSLSELPPKELETMIGNCLDRALKLGFRSEQALAQFTTLCFLLGPRFDEIPGFQKVITDSPIPLHRRLDEIYTLTSEQDWDQATEAYKRLGWGR